MFIIFKTIYRYSNTRNQVYNLRPRINRLFFCHKFHIYCPVPLACRAVPFFPARLYIRNKHSKTKKKKKRDLFLSEKNDFIHRMQYICYTLENSKIKNTNLGFLKY